MDYGLICHKAAQMRNFIELPPYPFKCVRKSPGVLVKDGRTEVNCPETSQIAPLKPS